MVKVNNQTYELNNCTVVRYEDDFGHSYEINGEAVAGVTTLLTMGMPYDNGLLEYFKRTDKDTQEQILVDAQERGTNVHGAIERLLGGETVSPYEFTRAREKKSIAAFVDWFSTIQPESVISEQVVAYVLGDIRYAGTLDCICEINGRTVLIDFKTSASPSRKYELQVEAYKKAIEQSTDMLIDDCYILYLGTANKGARVTNDENGLPTSGSGWRLIKSQSTFNDFLRVYTTAIYMNNGKYPSPPKVAAYPETWQLLKKREALHARSHN